MFSPYPNMRPNITYHSILAVMGDKRSYRNDQKIGGYPSNYRVAATEAKKAKAKKIKTQRAPKFAHPVPRQLVFNQVHPIAHQAPFLNGYQKTTRLGNTPYFFISPPITLYFPHTTSMDNKCIVIDSFALIDFPIKLHTPITHNVLRLMRCFFSYRPHTS